MLPVFFSSKCSLFHNANLFRFCIIYILYIGCAKIKKKYNSGAKGINTDSNAHVWRPRAGLFKGTGMENMRKEDVVAKWSYYPDSSTEELETTTQPLKAEQATSDGNLKHRPPENGRKIISTRPKLSLLLKLFCRILCPNA